MIHDDNPVTIPMSEVEKFLQIESRRTGEEQKLLLDVLKIAEQMLSEVTRVKDARVDADVALSELEAEVKRRDETIAQLIEEKVALELDLTRASSGGFANLGFKKWWSNR